MTNLRYFLFHILFSLLFFTQLSAAHFENYVELSIKVEDLSYNLVVNSVTFNGEDVPLEKSSFFAPRKVVHYKLLPGKYMLIWTTQKGTGRWPGEEVRTNERILVLEGGDTTVRINIKGDSISLY